MFKALDGDTCILVENGVYKVGALFEYNGYLFAKVGGGFVKLFENGSTSKAGRLTLESLQLDAARTLYRDPHGRIMTRKTNDKVSLLAPAAAAKLLELPPPQDANK
jgi:hypothetical protein